MSDPVERLEAEVGTVRVPTELLMLLTNLASQAYHGDVDPELVALTLAPLYPQLERIERSAATERGIDLDAWDQFGARLLDWYRERNLGRGESSSCGG